MMGNRPLVSIVLPTYNRAHFLPEAIESCLSQTYQNWELIIVDDHSEDNTPEVIRGFRDARIRSMRNERNRRPAGSLNAGFRQAKGDYFTFTSDDNVYRPEALETLVATIEATPEAGMVYAMCTLIDEHGKSFSRFPDPPAQLSDNRPVELSVNNTIGYCFLYRKAAAEAVGDYDEGAFLTEDWDYWLRLSSRFAMKFVEQDLYIVRFHPGSLTETRKSDVKIGSVRTRERNLPRLGWLQGADRARAYAIAAADAAEIGDLPAACRLVRQALRYSLPTAMATAPPGLIAKSLLPSWIYRVGRKAYQTLSNPNV